MPSRKGQPNDPKRRVAPQGSIKSQTLSRLAKARYLGSAHHKKRPGDYGYGLIPPVNTRHHKSVCDDLRPINLKEATRLFRAGVQSKMVSGYLENGDLPKFVWAVDDQGEAYEAKLGDDGQSYHGYRLYRDQRVRRYILGEWRARNQ